MSYIPKPISLFTSGSKEPEVTLAMKSFYENWLKYHSKESNLVLYHYTPVEGLKGILESRSIWCSHIKCFGDPLEWLYGEKLVKERIEIARLNEKDPNILEMLDNLIPLIKTVNSTILDTYVACFCETDNLLSQWRGYADKGGGYCLGIPFKSDTKITYDRENFRHSQLSSLRKIIYNIDKQKHFVDKAIQYLIESTQRAIARMEIENYTIPLGYFSSIAVDYVNILIEIIICLKNPVFSEENEWRLIIFKNKLENQENVKFRALRGELIPYLQANIYDKVKDTRKFPLKSIRIGPGLDSERAEYSVSLFVESNSKQSNQININFKEVKIQRAGYILRN